MTATDGHAWVLTVPSVQRSIRQLIGRKCHPFFLAYVHLRQQAGLAGSLTHIRADWHQLGHLLEVPGAPNKKPYLKPFQTTANRADEHQWWNSNIAGSWAPSSLRVGQGPLEVVTVNADKTYNLPDNHAQLALEHLLFDQRMSCLAFATFLFRDYGILSPHEPSPQDLIGLFRAEYYVFDDQEFETVYDPSASLDIPLFELFDDVSG